MQGHILKFPIFQNLKVREEFQRTKRAGGRIVNHHCFLVAQDSDKMLHWHLMIKPLTASFLQASVIDSSSHASISSFFHYNDFKVIFNISQGEKMVLFFFCKIILVLVSFLSCKKLTTFIGIILNLRINFWKSENLITLVLSIH